jgi:uncharacterized membrane protein
MNQQNIGLPGSVSGNGGAGIALLVCWVCAMLWFGLFIWAAFPGSAAVKNAAAGFGGLALLVTVLINAGLSNGWRGCLVYFVLALGISFGLEATSIAHGFPFGFYVHNMPGPKPLGVPPYVPLGYAVLGWLAWSVARLMVRPNPSDAAGLNRFTTPVVAAFILAGYDFSYDPIGSTVLHMWTYRNPSGYFGVPLSNFAGWLFTGWVFFQLFALVEARFPPRHPWAGNAGYWLLPCFVWGALALQYPILYAFAPPGLSAVGGRSFVTSDIYEASVVAAFLTMMLAAVTAGMRVLSWPKRVSPVHK